jgi:hypothetical protein
MYDLCKLSHVYHTVTAGNEIEDFCDGELARRNPLLGLNVDRDSGIGSFCDRPFLLRIDMMGD